MYPIDFFWRAADRYPARIAVRSPAADLTFAELAARVGSLAAAFARIDPEPGSRLAIGAANSVDHLVALLAAIAAGKVWVPLNPRNGTPELERILAFTEPSIVVLDAAMRERLPGVSGHMAPLEDIEKVIREHAGSARPALNLGLDATQAIKFTGGTTGVPKGVMQPMRAWNTTVLTQWHEFDFHADDRFLVSAPLTHGASTYVLAVLGSGGGLVFPPDTSAPTLLDWTAQAGVTSLFLPPTAIYALCAEQTRAPRDVSSLRLLIYGAAPMPPARIQETQRVFGNVVATTYGQTEAPTVLTCMRPDQLADPRNLGSVGRPSMNTLVAIMGKDGTLLGPGQEGEIVARGDLLMTGYWRMSEQTATTIVDGWLHTGDVGAFDERGFLFIKSRVREVIISGGFNVYPSDVEEAIGRHAAIYESAVVGIADDKWGEAVHAAVQLRPGASVSPEELIGFVKREIGAVKAPKVVHIFDTLPKSPVGKTLKDEVVRRIHQQAATQTGSKA
ncbi:class I adenylate-forming enzyme family protein [Cupriavidus necator]|nr:AMP-binding protein [Cupriavidus necator]MDX6008633.1 AMP-binding protein [Cupriavidus necator]